MVGDICKRQTHHNSVLLHTKEKVGNWLTDQFLSKGLTG